MLSVLVLIQGRDPNDSLLTWAVSVRILSEAGCRFMMRQVEVVSDAHYHVLLFCRRRLQT